jgi:hypothetical protein
MYGCEFWSLAVTEGQGAEENTLTYEEPETQRKVHIEELPNVYSSPDIIQVIK